MIKPNFHFFILAFIVCAVTTLALLSISNLYSIILHKNSLQGSSSSQGTTYSANSILDYQTSSTAQGNLYSANIGLFSNSSSLPQTSLPSISSTSITPYAVINSSNISLYIQAINAQSVWANITLPNGTVNLISLSNNSNTSYYNTNQTGRYNITFFANDSSGNIASSNDYFESFARIVFNVNISSYNSSNVISNLSSYYRGQSINQTQCNNSNCSLSQVSSLINLVISAFDSKFKLNFNNINLSLENNKVLGLDKLSTPISGYLATYGVNNNFSFANTTVTVYYSDTSYTNDSFLGFYKCDNWNFTLEQCSSTWLDITSQSSLNKSGDYFEYVTLNFSGFSIKQEQYCGDGTCNSSESCTSCSSDCGSCQQTASGGGSVSTQNCTTNWTCSEWSSCVNNTTTRICKKDNENCINLLNKPEETQDCKIESTPDKENEKNKEEISSKNSPLSTIKENISKLKIFLLALIAILISLFFLIKSRLHLFS